VHPRILAQRNAIATDRMVELAPIVAQRFGLTETVSEVSAKQPDILQMMRNEAVADLLEALAGGEAVQDDTETLLERIEAIDGVGPKTVELIRKELGK